MQSENYSGIPESEQDKKFRATMLLQHLKDAISDTEFPHDSDEKKALIEELRGQLEANLDQLDDEERKEAEELLKV